MTLVSTDIQQADPSGVGFLTKAERSAPLWRKIRLLNMALYQQIHCLAFKLQTDYQADTSNTAYHFS